MELSSYAQLPRQLLDFSLRVEIGLSSILDHIDILLAGDGGSVVGLVDLGLILRKKRLV